MRGRSNAKRERNKMVQQTFTDMEYANKPRDPEMHSTKKGNPWYFGMKIHSSADAGTGYVHTITATAANVHDIAKTHELVREDDQIPAISVWKSARKYGRTPTFQVWTTALPKDPRRTA